MSENLGSGVSRVLDPTATSYLEVIWQEGKPPLDSELNLTQALSKEWRRIMVLRGTPSGWLGNETNDIADFVTNSTWSNWFKYGRQRLGETQAFMWAVVNGWLVPVTSTRTGTPPGSPDDIDTYNVLALDPPPSNAGDVRVDFAFLEVFLARVPPNPSTLNKPAASTIYKYGNVESGNTYLADDLQDPAIGFETTERVQLQYRIRVAKGLVGLTTNPDGFDPTVVFGQGAATAATTYTFTNMRQTLGDPGLWRAGDGTANALGTVDGYTYAIPLAGIFRRNSVTWNGDPNQNLNGSFNRNPLAVDRTGILNFSTVPTLSADLSATATSATLVSAANIPLPTTPATAVLIKIGDELLTYTSITGTTLGGLTRAQNGTRADLHRASSTIQVISGRPDGLYADQIALTDVLDMRHVINPNGFDYDALLKTNLDKLLRGTLRANWKRSGAGPQGPFVFYQDKISATTPALGVTKLDAPDGIRQVFSDAASLQTVDCAVTPGGTVGLVSNTGFSLGIPVTQTIQSTGNNFSVADTLSFPVSALKSGVSGGDADQIRWVNDGLIGAVTLRIDGQNAPVPPSLYTVTPANPGPNDNLLITFAAGWTPMINPRVLFITLTCMYGAGRGLSRRANSIHNITFTQPSTELLLTPSGTPASNFPVRTSWAPLWSKYRNTPYKRNVPATSPAYADLGSKTVIVSPFRRIIWPTSITTIDGTGANPNVLTPVTTGLTGSSTGTTTFTDLNATFDVDGVVAGTAALTILPPSGAPPGPAPMPYLVPFGGTVTATTITVDRAIPEGTGLNYSITTPLATSNVGSSSGITFMDTLSGVNFATILAPYLTVGSVTGSVAFIILNGPQPGRYNLQIGSPVTSTTVTLDRTMPVASGLTYLVLPAQGMMPVKASDGVTAKWTTTDPLLLFSVSTDTVTAGFANNRNIYVTLPRSFIPNWGEVNTPILQVDGSTFNEGMNFMLLSNKGLTPAAGDSDYVAYASYSGQTAYTWASFTTTTFTAGAAPYNTLVSISGGGYLAGMQFFTDTRGLGRTGLQLPPFYGIARLFAVYEAGDYYLNRSAYNGSDRTKLVSGGATNLLRQNMSTPSFWIETDADGDSTFILNADAIDISRSTVNPITSFALGNYVIEASIFGFDRGSFNINNEFRLCLSRTRSEALTGPRYGGGGNVGAVISGPTSVLPGPATPTDSILINYSRTPYQGDAFGSQTNYVDIGQYLGPIQTATAFQLDSTEINESLLTRPNQKAVEVLASIGFATTLGTGRLSGDVSPPNSADFRNVGYEDPSDYPPATGADDRPLVLVNALANDLTEVGTQYLGATERLPMGSLFRDKDFRGGSLGLTSQSAAPLVFFDGLGKGILHSNLTANTVYEQTEIPLDTASTSSGSPGDLLAQVDGEPSNYSLLVNYRVNRGGSVFVMNGAHPGGEIGVDQPSVSAPGGASNVIEGLALLVRNTVTNVGANEVNSGDELMMLIITNVQQLKDTLAHPGVVVIGTNGAGEGYSASDLYRIEGHPMMNDNVRLDTNPSTITLSKRVA
jgi:hypothetical protein